MDVMVAALSRLEALERREAATNATVARLVQSVQRLEQQNTQLLPAHAVVTQQPLECMLEQSAWLDVESCAYWQP